REAAEIVHAGEPLRHRLDVGGIDLRAPAVDLVPNPPTEIKVAPVVDEAEIPGEKPPGANTRRRQVVTVEVAPHERGRLEPHVARLAGGARLAHARRRVDVALLRHRYGGAPADADQAVLGLEVADRRSGDPASGLRDAVGVGHVAGAAPAADLRPEMGR